MKLHDCVMFSEQKQHRVRKGSGVKVRLRSEKGRDEEAIAVSGVILWILR